MGTARYSVQCKPINHVRRFALYIKFTVSNKTLVHLLYLMKKVIQERKVVHKSPRACSKIMKPKCDIGGKNKIVVMG